MEYYGSMLSRRFVLLGLCLCKVVLFDLTTQSMRSTKTDGSICLRNVHFIINLFHNFSNGFNLGLTTANREVALSTQTLTCNMKTTF